MRLHPDQLANLSPSVACPSYARDKVTTGIVHLGIGAFHRAHQAWYTDMAMSLAGGNWGITGVSLRSDSVARQLQPQGGLYSLLAEDGAQSELRLIGAVKQVLVAREQLSEVVEAIASADTHIVSLTITEKGYCSDPAGDIDWHHPELASDLADPNAPVTAIGVLALGLERRFRRGGQPLTVLSCDNVSENGAVLQQRVTAYAARAWPALGEWLQRSVSFPSSMVDRIVPAITAEQRAGQSALLGADDHSAVATELFSQWVIEDRFVSPRPAWERVGVEFVDDIRPYEAMKLGLLNAAHTAIACVGSLCQQETVDEVMAGEVTGEFIRRLMREELVSGLVVPAGFDPARYCEQLLARFANPRLQHRCSQILMDSSVKIPQRWLPHLQQGGQHRLLLQALASWCHLVLATDITLDDPAAPALRELREKSPADPLDRVLAIAGICPQSVDNYTALRQQLDCNLVNIATLGLSDSLRE